MLIKLVYLIALEIFIIDFFYVMDKLIRLIIRGRSFNELQYGMYVLLLEKENDEKGKLPIVIESSQAKSIASV
ncbi:hypothetical protein [Blattabacterium cuenoti]|uniref:hypothetical protein n=1 Tax=Blattabacterium cuenoti TaxID=1653831 RepID=UPI001EECEFE3|nr:hypothetical protein [Blattabacterium cuenoti]